MRRALLLLVAAPSLSPAQWAMPLPIRNHRSADMAFLRFEPRSHTAAPGQTVLSYSLDGANEFQRSGPIDEDAETWRPLFHFARGLKNGDELFIEAPLVFRGGGFMDPLIEWWHSVVIHRPDPVRDSTPQGRSHIEFPGAGPFGPATAVGDVTVGLAREVRPNLVVRVAAKLPTGNPAVLAGSGNFDAGAALDWRVPFGRAWTLDLNGGLVLQGRATEMDGTRPSAYSSAIALTYAIDSRDAWTVQWNTEQSPTRTGEPGLDCDHRVLSFGFQRRIGAQSVLQLYFSENGDFLRFPGGPTVGPDLTVGARFVHRT